MKTFQILNKYDTLIDKCFFDLSSSKGVIPIYTGFEEINFTLANLRIIFKEEIKL